MKGRMKRRVLRPTASSSSRTHSTTRRKATSKSRVRKVSKATGRPTTTPTATWGTKYPTCSATQSCQIQIAPNIRCNSRSQSRTTKTRPSRRLQSPPNHNRTTRYYGRWPESILTPLSQSWTWLRAHLQLSHQRTSQSKHMVCWQILVCKVIDNRTGHPSRTTTTTSVRWTAFKWLTQQKNNSWHHKFRMRKMQLWSWFETRTPL